MNTTFKNYYIPDRNTQCWEYSLGNFPSLYSREVAKLDKKKYSFVSFNLNLNCQY